MRMLLVHIMAHMSLLRLLQHFVCSLLVLLDRRWSSKCQVFEIGLPPDAFKAWLSRTRSLMSLLRTLVRTWLSVLGPVEQLCVRVAIGSGFQ